MRFSDGVWRAKEGVKIRSAVEVGKLTTSISATEYWQPFQTEGTFDQSSSISDVPFVRALCHTKTVVNPGGTLGTPTISVEVTSPMDGVIGFDVYHFKGRQEYKEVRPQLFPEGPPSSRPHKTPAHVELEVDKETITRASITSRDDLISATLDCSPSSFGIEISRPGRGVLTSIGQESLQWILHAASPSDALEVESGYTFGSDPYHRQPVTSRKGFMAASLALSVGEKVYGLGERFGPLVKNGQAVELSNSDGGTSSYIAYKNVPFYLTNRNYGVYFDHTEALSIEIQSDRMTKVQASLIGERIRFYVITGDSPKDILERYTFMTGRAPILPDWSFGLWLSTSFLTKYDEPTVMDIIGRMEQEDIPLSVWHFDCFWSPSHEWCSFRWDPKNFPNPREFLKKIHDRGVAVCVWINPFVAQESRLFPEGDAAGYFIKRKNGMTFQCDDWQAGLAVVDFTNPEAVKWWQGYLEEVIEDGVDSFKTDFGEKVPVDDIVYYDGSDPKAMRNYYCFLYNKAVQEVLIRKRGKEQACLFARAATVGSQQLPVHWGGDCDSAWTGMAESLRGGLSLTLSGFAYWAHDIGGFKAEGAAGGYALVTPDADVYKRWVPFGLLSSHSRLHGSGSYRVPWLFGDEACRVLSKFTKLKHRLEPYITSLSLVDAVQYGTPLMRAMFVEFAQDPSCWTLDTQYMFGDKLLVAPIFDSSRVEYYVPAAGADWVNLLDGSPVLPGWHVEEYDMLNLPLLLRPNTALILGTEGHLIGQDVVTRGVTVVVSEYTNVRQVASSILLRGGVKIDVVIQTEEGADGKRSFKATTKGLRGDAQVELFVLGSGFGLNSEAQSAQRKGLAKQGGVAVVSVDKS